MKRLNNKSIVLLLSLLLVFMGAAGSTLAYLIDKTESVTDSFQTVQTSYTVTEDATTYKITNNSGMDVYVRLAVVGHWESTTSSNTLYWKNPTLDNITTSDWEKIADFYYYKGAVSSGSIVTFPKVSSTETAPNGYQLSIQILTEVIQTTPAAVSDAWKMTYDGSSWTQVAVNP